MREPIPVIKNQVFMNPLGVHLTPRQMQSSPKNGERITFGGEGFAQLEVSKYITQKSTPISPLEKTQVDEDELMFDLSALKYKVLGLLQAYAKDSEDLTENSQIKQKIEQEVQLVALEYSQIVEKVNKTDLSFANESMTMDPRKEQELNSMFNLVEEFLIKFDAKGQLPQNVSQLLKTRSQNLQKEIQSQQQPQMINSSQLKITILPTFPNVEDSFYLKTSLGPDKLHTKLSKLKVILTMELDKAQLLHTKQILSMMIQDLDEILKANDIQTVKSVVYRIEQGISQLNKEDQASANLYLYMQKAIKVTKKRISQIEQPQPVQKTLQRKFFDISLKMKHHLPPDHPKKQVMVSILFDDFIQSGLREEQMEQFIKSQLK